MEFCTGTENTYVLFPVLPPSLLGKPGQYTNFMNQSFPMCKIGTLITDLLCKALSNLLMESAIEKYYCCLFVAYVNTKLKFFYVEPYLCTKQSS